MADEDRVEQSTGSGASAAAKPRRGTAQPAGFGLRIYKPGQGYYTRMGTAIGIGILAVAGAAFLLEALTRLPIEDRSVLLPVQYGVSFGFVVVLGLLAYWIVGLNRKANDFFIATEGEMKKVRWSSRREVVRSTKVVIVTVILMGTFLFLWDIAFMLFFSFINVLKAAPGLERLFGSD